MQNVSLDRLRQVANLARSVASALDVPPGCRFRDRCSQAMEQCLRRPPLWVAADGRMSRCFLPMEDGHIAVAEGAGETPSESAGEDAA